MIVELSLSTLLVVGPPIASGPAEGPAPADPEGDVEPAVDAEPVDAADPDGAADPGAEPGAEAEPVVDEVAEIVAAAVIAAQDRAVLERNNQEVPEYVRQLDALASVEDRLDTCGRAVQAELRMNLALSYLRATGVCGEGEAEPEGPAALEFPGECGAETTANDCASLLLERVAEFGASGPAGAADPFAQAAGCPHAIESMTVERMYGACMVDEYGFAVDRVRERSAPPPDDRGGRPLNVPRWGSLLGIGLGVGAIAAGAVLVGIDGSCPGGGDPMVDFDSCPNVYNTDVGGAVLISVGALAVVGMGTILTITEIQKKRGKGKANTARLRRGMRRFAAVTGWQAPRLQLR